MYHPETLLSTTSTLLPFLIVVIIVEEVEASVLKLTLAVVTPVSEVAAGGAGWDGCSGTLGCSGALGCSGWAVAPISKVFKVV